MTKPMTPEVQDLTELVAQIVQLREHLKQVEADKQQAQAQVNTCTTQLLDLKKQMRDARKLLDHCLDTGEDVTSVKLTKTVSELTQTRTTLLESDYAMRDMYEKTYLQSFSKNFNKFLDN